MDLPDNTLLPFFAYGVFRRGEIAYLRVKEYVDRLDADARCKGRIVIRDGLPLLDPAGTEIVTGDLLFFEPKTAGRAYHRIVQLEPDRQYEWATLDVQTSEGSVTANGLLGLRLENGCSSSDCPFKGSADPLFKEAFALVDDALQQYSERQSPTEPNPDFKNLLGLQMAYMLLWTSIERYTTLRYGLGEDVMAKIRQLATDEFFKSKLREVVSRRDKLFPTNDPSSPKKLNRDNVKGSLDYYYQVRCNITHRGKAAFDDFDRLRYSLSELKDIFQATLANAFQESART